MGVVANTFWQMPGVLRSDNPHAFAAIGPKAALITAPHQVDVPHGLDSPVGRVYEQDGQVLLLGVGHDDNTTVHLAEHLAGVRYRRKTHVTLIKDGSHIRFHYAEIDHCCQNFIFVDQWLEAKGLQRKGIIGHAQASLIRSRDVVETVMERLRQDETIFLHPFGVDEQCDEARASLSQVSIE
jgi:aminoglycoside N3'-acetyltransferase